MHALPSHPKSPLLLAALVMTLALLMVAIAASDLGSVDLTLPAGGEQTSTAQPAQGGAPAAASPSTEPSWVTDPLSVPLDSLSATR
jgi:hypothetical protein